MSAAPPFRVSPFILPTTLDSPLIQVGFGWSNGAALDLINRYGKILQLDQVASDQPQPQPH